MTTKALFGAIALAVSTFTSAMAADVPMPYKAPPAAPAFSWTGCYVGGNGGGGRGVNEQQPILGITFNADHNSGWLAGVQGGCDYQVGSLVVGVEGQFDWADMKDTTATLVSGGALGGVDSKDSLLRANQIQGCFWGGSLGCDGPFGIERPGVGADGAADHRST